MASVQVNLSALNRFLNRTVQPYLEKKANEIADEAHRIAPQGATGGLRESITVQKGARGSVSVKVNAPYAGFVHEGTGPGHRPPNAPYYPKLRRRGLILWSESKSVNPYAVAQGISEIGTPANPFLELAIEKVLRSFQFKWIRKDLKL